MTNPSNRPLLPLDLYHFPNRGGSASKERYLNVLQFKKHFSLMLSLVPFILLLPKCLLGFFTDTFENQYIPNQYIVTLKGVGGALSISKVAELHKVWLFELLSEDPSSALVHWYGNFPGYSVNVQGDSLEKLRQRPEVDMIERDTIVGINRLIAGRKNAIKASVRGKSPKCPIETQKNAPWGLAKISAAPGDRKTPRSYRYPKSGANGVCVYVIDTGINISHSDFGGRARFGFSTVDSESENDENGHGTHCAGVIGGLRYGVAKNCSLVAVKVLNETGYGSNSDVIRGIDWVLSEHAAGEGTGIVSMSLGGAKSYILNHVVSVAIRAGISFAVAAGNDYWDACELSPGSVRDAITVGAVDAANRMAYFSNYGPCVDIFAPGVDIESAWIGGPYSTKTISGTSMATPHVAGVLALFASISPGTPAQLKEMLIRYSQKRVLLDLPQDTQNRLLCVASWLSELQKEQGPKYFNQQRLLKINRVQ